jgi:bifunctional oligoribonuclease and PAP phosphatase NrnA
MRMLDFDRFMKTLGDARSVGLTAPAFGDGDSVGTQCALKEILEHKYPKLKVRIINETACPRRYQFLHHADAFEISEAILREDPSTWPEIMVCVDGNFERVGDDTMKIWNAAKKRGQVDHHAISGADVYDFRLYQPEAAATTEIVFDLVRKLGLPLTKTIAQSLYMGLIFDTGLFKHSNTTPKVMRIGAELLETGFNHTQTAEEGLLIRTPPAFDLLKSVLAESHFEMDARYVWGVLSYAAYEKSGADADDKEGLIDQLFLTTKCEIAAFYFEIKPQMWKVSFRARKHWDVAALARTLNPQGGGHKKAAGCSLEGPMGDVLSRCHKSVKALLAT